MKKLEIVLEDTLLPILLIFSMITLVLVSVSVYAQAPEQKKVMPAQVSLVYPIGSNGIKSFETTNRFSLNIIAGLQGGVDGAEVAGFANIIRHDVAGFQAAGFANIVGGSVKGSQFAGFANVVGGPANGWMAAGFANSVQENSHGLMTACFLNNTVQKATGLQIAGFANHAGKESDVMQLAGFANVSQSHQKGLNIAGFANVAKEVDGAQVSGFANVTKVLRGTQLGFINIADTVEKGAPIGFLSIVRKNGVHHWEIGASETLHAFAKYKTGVAKVYNILAIGGQISGDRLSWAYGYGIGSTLLRSDRLSVGLEGVCMHVNYGRIWTDDLNLLNRISLPISFNPSQQKGFYFAPSANLMVSRLTNQNGEVIGAKAFVPYHIYDRTFGKTNLKGWVGLEAGFRF